MTNDERPKGSLDISHSSLDIQDMDFRADVPGDHFAEEGEGVGVVDYDRKNLADLTAVALEHDDAVAMRAASQLEQGTVVVCAGGGGIPTMYSPDGSLTGVEAVIDKDLTSAHMANILGIELMMILTAVPRVAINFGSPQQTELSQVTMRELRAYEAEGHFPPGSMGPKVSAALRFLEGGGERVIIAHLGDCAAALRGAAGTHIVADDG